MTNPTDLLVDKFAADQTMLHTIGDIERCDDTGQCQPEKVAEPLNISVNGVAIAEDEILAEVQHHPAPSQAEALRAAAEALVVRQLLLQRAETLGLGAEPNKDGAGNLETPEEALVRTLIDVELEAPVATESECLRYYHNHRSKFASEPLYEVRHILLAVASTDSEKRDLKRQQAEQLIVQLQQNPGDFTDAVRACSDCPSKEVDGSLGQISRGATVKEFEAALAAMEQGTISPAPVETRYGFHIIALDQKVPGEPLPFAVVKERISAWLGAVSWSRAVSQYVRVLAGKAVITGIQLEQADGPLVQ